MHVRLILDRMGGGAPFSRVINAGGIPQRNAAAHRLLWNEVG